MRFSILVNPGLSVRMSTHLEVACIFLWMSTHLDGSGMHTCIPCRTQREARCQGGRELGAAADLGDDDSEPTHPPCSEPIRKSMSMCTVNAQRSESVLDSRSRSMCGVMI